MTLLPWRRARQIDARELDGGDHIRGEYFGAYFTGAVIAVLPRENGLAEVHVKFDEPLKISRRRIASACLFVDSNGRMLSDDGVLLGAIYERIENSMRR